MLRNYHTVRDYLELPGERASSVFVHHKEVSCVEQMVEWIGRKHLDGPRTLESSEPFSWVYLRGGAKIKVLLPAVTILEQIEARSRELQDEFHDKLEAKERERKEEFRKENEALFKKFGAE